MSLASLRCPARRCGALLPYGYLLCPGHWKLVPQDLKATIYDAWLRREGSAEAHAAAISAAIRYVNDVIGERT